MAMKPRFLDHLCPSENFIFANYQKQQRDLRSNPLEFNCSPAEGKRTESSLGG